MSEAAYDVYYDASCPLCRAEIAALVDADVDRRLRLHDCSAPDFSDPQACAVGIDRAAMMAAMHLRDPTGRWLSGVDAFEVMYRAVGIESIARLWGHPWLKPLWRRVYPWVARHRQPLSRLGLTGLFERSVRRAAAKAARRRCESTACTTKPDS